MSFDYPDIEDIEEIIKNRDLFDKFVYTPITEVMNIIKSRRLDPKLRNIVHKITNCNIPLPLQGDIRGVLFRQLMTPNFEFHEYIKKVKELNIEPLLWEYSHDKFVSNNEIKYYLGKLNLFKENKEKGRTSYEKKRIVDFELYNGKKFKDVKTIWGEDLISFHHSLLSNHYSEDIKKHLYDSSSWFEHNGSSATKYYHNYLSLFLIHGIQFENFMINTKEVEFIKDVFLPAFIKIYKETGFKPIIVNLLPTDREEGIHWMSHDSSIKKHIDEKISKCDFVVQKSIKFVYN